MQRAATVVEVGAETAEEIRAVAATETAAEAGAEKALTAAADQAALARIRQRAEGKVAEEAATAAVPRVEVRRAAALAAQGRRAAAGIEAAELNKSLRKVLFSPKVNTT